MTKPQLYIFAISHYCEKACWALRYLGIDHELRHVAPGIHVKTAKQLGASRSSLPILVAEEETIQGSANIISWADDHSATEDDCLTPASVSEECLEVEKRLDDVVGVHLRRYYYSEAMVNHPKTVRPIFTQDLPLFQRLMVGAAWGVVRTKMIEAMDLGERQGQESKRIVEDELDWLDTVLSDGRRFLVGNRFSRADLTAASLLSPLAQPKEHPSYSNLEVPPKLVPELEAFQKRPTVRWVRGLYSKYRTPSS